MARALQNLHRRSFSAEEALVSQSRWITIDGNEAVANVAYRASEVIAIYPITPSSPSTCHGSMAWRISLVSFGAPLAPGAIAT